MLLLRWQFLTQPIKHLRKTLTEPLSNLNTPTKVNVDLLPDSTNARNLGSKSKSWKNVFAKGSYYLGGDKFISNPGTYNTFIGSNTGNSNTAGYDNTATGAFALYSNSSGNYNTANGVDALYSNTYGIYNTANGVNAMYNNTTGYDNTATGANSLYANTTGCGNTANGKDALYGNSTGYSNTANGAGALVNNTTGGNNTANGTYALSANTTGYYNTAVGSFALDATTASDFNTSVGYNAGSIHNNGWNNVFLGANTNVNSAGFYNVIAIGQDVTCTASSQARIGNAATNSIGGYANWTNISDGRVKRNIKQNVPGLQFINMLQPITYNLDLTAADNIVQAQRKDSAGKIIPLSNIEITARKAKEQIVYTGFVAQDVEKAAKSMNYDFSGVDAAKNSKDLYGLRYSEFVVPLVKAVQELSVQNDLLKQNNASQQMQIDELKSMVQALANKSGMILPSSNATLSSASLQQNIPNPYKSSTTISYTLPDKFSSAYIIVTDNSGKILKQINLSGSGKGNLNIDGSTLSSGAYQYSLYVDGKIVDSKQMISSK
ncbi:MAG: tail fiber domain-containing protein [Chitinophagaceae bacterium]